MKALDTNILARYYTKDDPAQSPIALRIMSGPDALFVPRTVVLEFVWVLESSYRLRRSAIERALSHLLGLRNVIVENAVLVESALELYRGGFDFADALHWAASRECSELLTFDTRRFAARAVKARLTPPCRVPK